MTNRSIPPSRASSRTCSSRGLPFRSMRGLGRVSDTLARRLPLPAARIRPRLLLGIIDLFHRGCIRFGTTAAGRSIRRVVEILNRHIRFADHASLGDAFRRGWEPEIAALLILVDEMNTARPERRVLRR